MQKLPDDIAKVRVSGDYFIATKEAILIPPEERKKVFTYKSQSNVWYGNEKTNIKVLYYLLIRQ